MLPTSMTNTTVLRLRALFGTEGADNGAVERGQRLQQQKRLQGQTGLRAVR